MTHAFKPSLWSAGQEEGTEAGMREICMEVANQLEAVAASGEDFEDDAPERVPANQRFMAAVQAAVQTAEAMGVSDASDTVRYAYMMLLSRNLLEPQQIIAAFLIVTRALQHIQKATSLIACQAALKLPFPPLSREGRQHTFIFIRT